MNYASSINCRAHEPRDEDDKESREDGVSGGVSWLKRGAVFLHRALLLYNRLIFTDYEERLLFLRGRCNSAWKFSAVSAASPFGKYDN